MSTTREQGIEAETLLTSYQVGALLQVNPSSVNKWVKDGRIRAFRTPGGHRRIRAADLVAFLNDHDMPVPQGLREVSRRRLLIVDDDRKQLDAFTRLLKPYAERLDVVVVDNGIDAAMQLGIFRPHVVVMEVTLHHIDALEMIRRLRKDPENKELQLVVSSGDMTPELESRSKEAGADYCLQKPVELPALLNALRLAD